MGTGAAWVLRVLWFLLPLTLGQAVGDAASSAPHAVPQVLTIGLWILWSVGMIALMVPLPRTLTVSRLLAPGVLAAAIWALFDLGYAAIAVVAVVHGAAVTATALHPLVGDQFVDGASYGNERRMLLRPPAQLGYIAVPLLWALVAAGLTIGPLLLGGRQWIWGVIATVVGFGVVFVGGRAVHQLTQRWVVFVPTGLVLHDLNTLTEPVLFRRTAIERLGPAVTGTPARDLTHGATGLVLECELADAAPLGLRDEAAQGGAGATLTDVRRFLFAPSRPGELLNEAERRNIAVPGS